MEQQKKITRLLQSLGRREPNLLLIKLDKVDLTDKERAIMVHRYIDKLEFKQIPCCDDVRVSENQVFKVHKKALEKTVDKLELAEYLALFVK